MIPYLPSRYRMRYLITGGAGFIGSHLADRLLAQGDRVRILDDLSTGDLKNLQQLQSHPEYSFTEASVCDRGMVDRLVADCDLVFHLAAVVGVDLVVSDPRRAIHVNLQGTETVLDAAAAAGAEVVLASSSEVYGASPNLPFREDAELSPGPSSDLRSGYAFSKAMAECSALARTLTSGLRVMTLRFFNTVGPRQTGEYGMVLPRFLSQAMAGEPITVYGDGRQTRCFAEVSEVVDCILRLIAEPSSFGRVFNVGSDLEISIADLAQTVRRLTGSSSELQFLPLGEVNRRGSREIPRRVPDLSRLREAIGQAPSKSPAEIIGEMMVPVG